MTQTKAKKGGQAMATVLFDEVELDCGVRVAVTFDDTTGSAEVKWPKWCKPTDDMQSEVAVAVAKAIIRRNT